LPPATLVYPGHDYADLLFSTISCEKAQNPHWKIPSRDEFVAFKGSERIVNPEGAVRRTVEANLACDPGGDACESSGPITACGTRSSEGDRVATISVEKLRAKLDSHEAGSIFIDVREPEEFVEGHVPGAVNLPLSELGFQLDRLSAARRCYFSCQSGGRSILAVRTLTYLGIQSAVNLTGGYQAWKNAGNRIETA
ncbi:MAG TPA: rhodanese-like domain-containing protein, partial [Bdellovibrionota bacterium]|nr:rhodanese-like domain-containing protein [Bdellovibrionota bacterium]